MEPEGSQLRRDLGRLAPVALGPLALGLAVFALFPSARPWILEEDRLIETLSALTFFAAGAWASLLLLQRRGRDTRVLGLVAFLGLLGCADELSFGERLFELEMPTIRGLKIDGAHDFAEVIAKGGRDLWRAQPVIFTGLLGGLLIGMGLALRNYHEPLLRLATAVTSSPGPLALVLATAFVGIATVIDLPLPILDSDWVRATEELLELSAGGLLMAAAGFSRSPRVSAEDADANP